MRLPGRAGAVDEEEAEIDDELDDEGELEARVYGAPSPPSTGRPEPDPGSWALAREKVR